MIAVEDVVLVLLAAGQSTRFGGGNKLEQDFLGKPVGMHVVTALEDIPFRERIAITDGCKLDFAGHGFTVLHNPDVAAGMSESLRLGVASAKERDAAAVLIALADMPRVTGGHIYNMIEVATGDDTVVASSDGEQPRPPALFGRGQFDFLMNLKGDLGAREMVRAGKHVVTTPAELIDVDTPEQLEKLRRLVHAPERRV